jgi:predicted ABC-type transport system involved in lysophospholipase L1 biosynthesis ATPase subunit
MLEARDIHKTYEMPHKTIDVLKGAQVSVAAGESVAIIGLSGAGKTTLLHILGGLDRPQGGTVSLEGESVYDLSESRRSAVRANKIGFVFQTYHLLPEMSVLENVMLPAMVHGHMAARGGAVSQRALHLLDTVGLAERATHMPMELSGGEQQRVALSRALMNEPHIVLADEPTGNLDSRTGRQVLDNLFAMTVEQGYSLVMVTHNADIAATCNRVMRIDEGKIVEV